MDIRPSRGRGGGWKRGGRGGNDAVSFVGEHRGRGRGGHHRGRAKRDHYRGRGRGGSAHAAEFHHRDQGDGEDVPEEDERTEEFSRRKLESNWDRYEESERQEPDDDTPSQRGTDYHVLLESAGDSFTQFRFSEEKDWEMDSASQMCAVFVDLPALTQTLQQVPLHQRLNLEAELLQVSTPIDLPAMTITSKQERPKPTTVTAPALKVPVATNSAECLPVDEDDDDDDEELDQLLSLQKPVLEISGRQSVSVADESLLPEEVCEEVKEATEEQMEEVKDEQKTRPKSASARKEVTEEDLEDWLDNMIS